MRQSTWFWAAFALAGAAVVVVARPTRTASADAPKPGFVGADACKKCHLKQWKSWKETGMAKAFEDLKPGAVADKKKAAGLDPQKDFTKDAGCVACHVTGYGTETGFPALPAEGKTWTAEETARATLMAGVSCEACHGPGSLYPAYKKEHPHFKFKEIAALGAVHPNAEDCMKCHVHEVDAEGKLLKGSPTMPKDYKFDFATAKSKHGEVHEHVPLKEDHGK
jgi:hypothetical protein